MKKTKTLLAIGLACISFANFSLADNDFLSIYNSEEKCELRKHGPDGGYLGAVVKSGSIPVKGKNCNIALSKEEFESTYRFCALSGFTGNAKELSCNFSQMDNGEYYFLSSPGTKSCKFVCERK
jgi:hypothetical protein